MRKNDTTMRRIDMMGARGFCYFLIIAKTNEQFCGFTWTVRFALLIAHVEQFTESRINYSLK